MPEGGGEGSGKGREGGEGLMGHSHECFSREQLRGTEERGREGRD